MNKKTYKQNLLDILYEPYKNPTSCPFDFPDVTHTVLGEGNPDAKLMFIGEAPGRDEDAKARPFVGRSGKLLTRILEEFGLKREDVFITNVVKWRPPNNRQPSPAEMEIGKKLMLIKEIAIIQPTIICTLGATALNALTMDPNIKISKVRGKILTLDNVRILPTYHPAYILRNNAELEKFMSDIELAIEISNDFKKD